MRRLILILLLALFFNNLYSQTGTYFIKNYSPNEYNGSNQVWDIVQDNRGIMYFAADQVLEYDGVDWRKIPLPNKETVRSLAIDTARNIIYVGGVNEFGYLTPDSLGKLTYKSLSQDLDSNLKNFEDVWRTEVCNGDAYFSTNTAIFKFSLKDKLNGKNPFKVWKEDVSFFLMYKYNNRIFTGLRGKGIVEIKNDSLVPIDNGSKILENMSWFMLPYEKNKILLGNSRGGLQVFDEKEISLSKSPYFNEKSITKTDSILYKNQLYGGIYIGDGLYALATIRTGVVIVNKQGETVKTISKEFGLQSQTVHYLFKDKQGGLWAALTYGISRIEINTPITLFNDLSGIEGSIYNTIRTNNEIYVSSNLGLFKREKDRFIPVEGISGKDAVQCFGLDNININGKTKLLAATTHGIYEVEGLKSKRVFTIDSYSNYQLDFTKNTILLSDGNTIYLYKYENNKWNEIQKIEFNEEVSNFTQIDSSKIWFIKNGEICNIGFIDNYQNHTKTTQYETVDSSIFINIIELEHKLYFLSDSGLYKIKENKLVKDKSIFDGVLNNEKNITEITQVNGNQIWIKIKRELQNTIKIIHKKDNKYFIDSISFKRLPSYDDFRADGDSIMWVISAQALYRVDVKKLSNKFNKETVLNRLVKINNDSIVFKGTFYTLKDNVKFISNNQSNNELIKLSYNLNNITFEFALPSFDNEAKNLYSYCLIRNNEDCAWSDWVSETKKEYTNLHEGTYIFKLRAKNIYCQISKTSEYKFVVLPPWYRTYWAYLFYVITFIVVIVLITKYYTRKLIKEKEHLEVIVRERTQEIWEQKEEIQQQAENLKTTNDELIIKHQEINQQNAEISAQRDNLQELTESLFQRTEEIKVQNEELEQQKETLETINEEIHDSIEYAFRIQNAALPKKKILKDNVDDSFILFKPKDLVSGDFYWFEKIEDTIVITAADCTGHGVPGALMSILGMAIIKEIVVGEFITHPGVILRKIRKGIISALDQNIDSIEKDGMDMSLISINKKEKTIQYSGAFNPLYIIRPIENCTDNYEFMIEVFRDEKYILFEIKPDKMPVSIYVKMDRFTTHEFDYKPGDMFYMFSDGYADQFGGPKRKKFKYKPFKKLLLENAGKPMSKQKETLNQVISDWQGNLEQIDDIVVIGIRL